MINPVGGCLPSEYGAGATGVGAKRTNGSDAAQPRDTLEISPSGSLLSQLGALKLPTWENVGAMKREFALKLGQALGAAGIENDPPFTITQDCNTGVFTVGGNNPQAAACEALLNGDDDLKLLHHNMDAIASHLPGIEASLKFQQEYRAAKSPAAIEAVVAKYSQLFSGPTASHAFTTTFGPQGAVLLMDGDAVA